MQHGAGDAYRFYLQHELPDRVLHNATISRPPDPLEPIADVHLQHPLHDGLNFSTSQELHRRLLQHGHVHTTRAQDSPSKRRQREEAHAIALPRLPVRDVRQQRPRLPPTLSGLHQPPPNAGLLPRISIHDAVPISKPALLPALPPAPRAPSPLPQDAADQESARRRTKKHRWSEAETIDLMKGVARFGIGNWTAIWRCKDYNFNSRTALDLKDRFRVCRPEDYSEQGRTRSTRKHEVSSTDLAKLGVKAPFDRSSRRKRHGYTDTEDARLLKGFERHGKQWALIQRDAELNLGHRTRTDLRDRVRTRFPDLFNKTAAIPVQPSSREVSTITPANAATVERTKSPPTQSAPAFSQLDTDWSFDIDSTSNAQPITLDRGILDWPVGRLQAPEQHPTFMQQGAFVDRLRPWQLDFRESLPASQVQLSAIDDIDKPTHTFLTFDELLS